MPFEKVDDRIPSTHGQGWFQLYRVTLPGHGEALMRIESWSPPDDSGGTVTLAVWVRGRWFNGLELQTKKSITLESQWKRVEGLLEHFVLGL